MEREILFRGKRVDNGEWVEGNYNLLEIGSNLVPIIIPFQKLVKARMSDAFMYQIDLSTRGQFTGLYDSTKWESLSESEQKEWLKSHTADEWKGRRIFEGDIIVYQGKRYSINYLKHYARFSAVKPNTVFCVFAYQMGEVIGNIHDTPELLGGETICRDTK